MSCWMESGSGRDFYDGMTANCYTLAITRPGSEAFAAVHPQRVGSCRIANAERAIAA